MEDKKDTKITTLRCAIAYINSLSGLLSDVDAGLAVDPQFYRTDAELGIHFGAEGDGEEGGKEEGGKRRKRSGRKRRKKKGGTKKKKTNSGRVNKRKNKGGAKTNRQKFALGVKENSGVSLAVAADKALECKTIVSSLSPRRDGGGGGSECLANSAAAGVAAPLGAGEQLKENSVGANPSRAASFKGTAQEVPGAPGILS